MMATNITLQLKTRFAWWLKPYLYALLFCCAVFSTEPDPQKLDRVLRRAVRVRAVRGEAGAVGD